MTLLFDVIAMLLALPSYLYLMLLFFALLLLAKKYKRKHSHKFRLKQAARVHQKLTTIPRWQQQLAYLRKIDPFVFEELLLTGFAANGYQITRNKRYTGDGGIDGKVMVDGEMCLIQAKRYKGHINLAHVRAFDRLLTAKNCKGYFCHTGRTGKATAQFVGGSDRMMIISGQKLTKLLTSTC